MTDQQQTSLNTEQDKQEYIEGSRIINVDCYKNMQMT